MNTFLAACMFTCCMSCQQGKMVKTVNSSDTTLLSRIDKPVSVGAIPAVSLFTFSENNHAAFDSNSQTWLLFDDPIVTEAPDGVYEIYLTDQPPLVNELTATNPAFVNVLDLYSITAPGAKQIIEVNITSAIKKMFLQKQELRPFYLTLIFSGNRLPDGSQSKNAGKMELRGIRMVQTKR